MKKVIFQGKHVLLRRWHVLLILLLLLMMVAIYVQSQLGNHQKKPKVNPPIITENEVESEDTSNKDDGTKDKDSKQGSNQHSTVAVCKYADESMIELLNLLKDGDFCSEDWFRRLDTYIVKLEGQLETYRKQKQYHKDQIVSKQEEILNQLRVLRKQQTKEVVDKLERTIEGYQKMYQEACKGVKE